MRAIVIGICLAACGGAPMPAKPPPPPRPKLSRPIPDADRPPVDPIARLTPDDAGEVSWVVPGPIQLELSAALNKVYGEILDVTGDRRIRPPLDERQILLLPRGDCTDAPKLSPMPPASESKPSDKTTP